MYSGAKILVESLKKHNVTKIFGYAGGTVLSIFDNLQNENIKYYVNTHEQFCCHSGTGYAKATNDLGVVLLTSGPSITNAITGILDANNDSVPLLVLSGQVSKNVMGTGSFQEAPSVKLTKPITKWSYMINNVNDIEKTINRAINIAKSERPGVVHIDIPKCILSEKTNIINNDVIKNKEEPKYIDHDIFELIRWSKKPVILLGNGCKNANFSELITKYINKNKILVTTTLHGVGIVDETNPLSLKFAGMHGSYKANMALMYADCIIGIGARFDDRVISNIDLFAPNANKAFINGTGGIINCNINKKDFNKTIKSHFNINMDALDFIKKLLNYTNSPETVINSRINWINEIKKIDWNFNYKKTNELKTQDVICSLNKFITTDTIITTGVGNHQMMAAQYIDWKASNKLITSGSLGVMGVGLPYAIGAKIAYPNSTVIDIDGDSSFNQSLSDLATVAKYNLPIKIAIMNDNYQTMVRTWEQLFYNKDNIATSCEGNPDYDILAKAFNIKGIKCDNKNDLSRTVKYFMDYEGPIICNFKVLGEKCLPLLPPGKSVKNTILYDKDIITDTCNVPS